MKESIMTGTPGQEDWGWYLLVQRGVERYFLGICGYRKERAQSPKNGEWRIIVEKRRSVWEKILGRNEITDCDPVFLIIEAILREQSDVQNIARVSP
jgi:hypothetical protein